MTRLCKSIPSKNSSRRDPRIDAHIVAFEAVICIGTAQAASIGAPFAILAPPENSFVPDAIGPLIVALDVDTAEAALQIAQRLDPARARVKVGKQLFTREGPELVRRLQADGFEVFLDLKFHDIPNTVAKAVAAAADLGVWMVNVHAGGGSRMMRAAREALEGREHRPLLTAVTVLTSMDESDLRELGVDESPLERVLELAGLAHRSGLDGVVCSAAEAEVLRGEFGPDFLLVTPGIRLPGDAVGDQRRVVTPEDAISAGASYLVMGRSITGASDPAATVNATLQSLLAS